MMVNNNRSLAVPDDRVVGIPKNFPRKREWQRERERWVSSLFLKMPSMAPLHAVPRG
jgi:hypothetical protein